MLEHLVSDHEHGFEGEATATFVDLIFQTSEDVHSHEVVRVLGPEVVDLGEAGRILELTAYFVRFLNFTATYSRVEGEKSGVSKAQSKNYEAGRTRRGQIGLPPRSDGHRLKDSAPRTSACPQHHR